MKTLILVGIFALAFAAPAARAGLSTGPQQVETLRNTKAEAVKPSPPVKKKPKRRREDDDDIKIDID